MSWPPVEKDFYNKVNKTIKKREKKKAAAVEVQKQSMQHAGQLEYELANSTEDTILRDIDVSSDGTWMTPGLSSTAGVATTIGCVTGKVLGFVHGVKSVSHVNSGRRETRTAGCIAAGERNMYVQ